MDTESQELKQLLDIIGNVAAGEYSNDILALTTDTTPETIRAIAEAMGMTGICGVGICGVGICGVTASVGSGLTFCHLLDQANWLDSSSGRHGKERGQTYKIQN